MVTLSTPAGSLPTKAKPSNPSSKPPVHIRLAHLTEGPQIGRLAAKTYINTPLTVALSPYRSKYYSHYERGFVQRAITRMLSPRNMTFVAISKDKVVGYAQFVRLGEDEGAKRQMASRNGMWLGVLGWIFWLYCLVVGWVVGGDKSADLEALRSFDLEVNEVEKMHWEGFPERKNRWHAQSVVVAEEWQGRGIGKRLMGEVIVRAEAEGVCVGLEASEEGERMYRRVGFELLGCFQEDGVGASGVSGGGIMLRTPLAWKVVKN